MIRMIGTATMLERHGLRRSDTAWLAGLLAAPDAGVLVLVGNRAVIDSDPDRTLARIRWLTPAALVTLGISLEGAIFLGTDPSDGGGRFALHIPEHAAARFVADGGPLHPAVDTRSLAAQGVMETPELTLIAQVKALTSWTDSSRCCGRCGARMRPRDGGWRRQCTACDAVQFPRLDPVVIMLVTDGTRAVLAHEPRFPEAMMSTIAGYIEAGEDIEQAVARETREELGLEVARVRYEASQPWPFPHSLMIGCTAEVAPGPLVLDPDEIAHARWCTRDEVRSMFDRRHPEGLWLPGPIAIAHWLIRRWLER